MRFSIATLTLLAAAALAAPLPGDSGPDVDIGGNSQKNINNQKTIVGNDVGLGLLQQDQRLAPLYNNPNFIQAAQNVPGVQSTTSIDELIALLVRHLNLNSYTSPNTYQQYLPPGYQQQQPPPYYQQGYQPQGYQPQGYPPQGYPPQGYPQLYQQQQQPPQGYPPNNYGGLGASLLSTGGGAGGFTPQNLGQQQGFGQGQPFTGRLNRRSVEGANVEDARRGGE